MVEENQEEGSNLSLTVRQEMALKELLGGKTCSEAANAAGVSRKTVHNWKNENEAFRAELNRHRLHVWEKFLATVNQAVEESMATILRAIKNGDVKTARWLLEQLDFSTVFIQYAKLDMPSTLTEPSEVKSAMVQERARKLAGQEIEVLARNKPHLFLDEELREELTKSHLKELVEEAQREDKRDTSDNL